MEYITFDDLDIVWEEKNRLFGDKAFKDTQQGIFKERVPCTCNS